MLTNHVPRVTLAHLPNWHTGGVAGLFARAGEMLAEA